LHYAIDALENGYYEVAMTLLRSFFENKLVMMYFDKFPTEAEQWWMNDKKIEQAKIREKLGLKVEKGTYGLLSNNYAHPLRSDSLIPMIQSSGKTWEGFHPYPYYIQIECRLSVGCWISFANDTIKLLLKDFQPEQFGDRAWEERVSQVLQTSNQVTLEIAQDLWKEAEKYT
jgi:hypothetical protein